MKEGNKINMYHESLTDGTPVKKSFCGQAILIDRLKNIDLFRVYADSKRKDIKVEVEKMRDGIEKKYYNERKMGR